MGIHDGHRKNLRQSFLVTGFAGKTEHQALELLLTYSIPRIDVNPVAHELIDKFGSLAGVIDAEPTELMKINHITENTVVLLKMIPALWEMYADCKWSGRPVINTSQKVKEFLKPKFMGCCNERLYMLCLDSHLQLNELALLAEGTPDQTTVNIRDAVAHVLHSGAKQVILAHNHPSGITDPSMQDIIMTHNACNAFAPMGVNVIDHMIFAGNEVFSLRANGFMKDLPEDE